ncbi:MAG TPA: insulinase family protein, partial [Saprospiraceae bacterium]|nr:insulinase family protein [Saprospiraceae bacterium]
MKLKLNFNFLFFIIILGVISCSPKIKNETVKPETKINSSVQADVIVNAEKTSVDPKKELDNALLSRKIPVDPSFKYGVLDNGMHYFIKNNHKPENRVELRLAVNAGSVMEDDDQKGLAHFIEHMQFNGSEHFSKNDLINYLERVGTQFGADLNAYTSFDETVYKLQVRTDKENQLDTGLLVMYDWAGKATFDPEEIDKERGVVISEWRTGLSPEQRMQNKYFPVLSKGSKYAERLPIGDPEIIKNADYNTIKRFYKDWYRPDLMALVVVGDVDVDK